MTTPYMTLKNNSMNALSTVLTHYYPNLNQSSANTSLELNFGQEQCASITFHRTLRIPDDNKTYGLPPSLGAFPLHQIEDHAQRLPASWLAHKGIFLPMYQSEAMWLSFQSKSPIALKIATGKINAISGKPWSAALEGNRATGEQPDYIVIPKQPWIDGFNVGKGLIKQFVAVPMGKGYTVEEQITGRADVGGIQIIAYPMKAEVWADIQAHEAKKVFLRGALMNSEMSFSASSCTLSSPIRSQSVGEMGLGQGGFMKQDIYADEYGIDVWDTTRPLKVFVHLVNSQDYQFITGHMPPAAPLGPKDYMIRNYPWFDYYDEGQVLNGSAELAKVDSIGSMQTKKQENILGDNTSISMSPTIPLGQKLVKNGQW